MKTFSQRVIEIALSIPRGRVTTYGRIAKACGAGAMASQSITAILGKACTEGVETIPFHRIVYANGRVWMDTKHTKQRMALYKKEGIEITKDGRVACFDDLVIDFN